MILAEELVLLALQPDGAVVRGGAPFPAIGWAVTLGLVVDLERDGHLELDETGGGQLLDVLAPHQATWPGARRRIAEAFEQVPLAAFVDGAANAEGARWQTLPGP